MLPRTIVPRQKPLVKMEECSEMFSSHIALLVLMVLIVLIIMLHWFIPRNYTFIFIPFLNGLVRVSRRILGTQQKIFVLDNVNCNITKADYLKLKLIFYSQNHPT